MNAFFTFYRGRLRVLRGILVGGFVALLLSFALNANYFSTLRNSFTDALYVGNTQTETSGLVSIVAIDDDSLAAFGRSPSLWSRVTHADLVDVLGLNGARVITFDVLFAEPTEEDARFAEALENARAAVPGEKLPSTIVQPVGGRQFVFDSTQTGETITFDQFIYPVDAILNASADRFGTLYKGHVNFNPDDDGFVRRVPLSVIDENGQRLPTLGLTTYLAYLRLAGEDVTYTDEALSFSGRQLDIDEFGQMLLYFFDTPANSTKAPLQQSFPVYSYVDVLCSYAPDNVADYALLGFDCATRPNPVEVPPDAFQGQMVMIGVLGAITEPDRFPVPIANATNPMYGVEIHANVVENIHQGLDGLGRNLPLRAQSLQEQVAVLLLMTLVSGAIMPLLRWYLDILLVGVMYGAYFLVAVRSFQVDGLVMELLFPGMALVLTLAGVFVLNYLLEERRRNQINDLFQRYVSPEIARKIVEISDRGELSLEGEEREITIMFADIRGFTTLSEGLPPQEVVDLLNTFLERMNAIVLKHGGAINKYIGDNLMAFWNAPYPQDDHAWLAVQAGIELLEAVEDLNQDMRRGSPVLFGIGVNTGTAVIGNIGSSQRLEYTPIGDTVNIASRLSGFSKGGSMLVGAGTYDAVKDRIQADGQQAVLLKGKTAEVVVYEFSVDAISSRKTSAKTNNQ